MGFDDFAWADLLEPPITTMDQHIEEIGRMAGEEMLALLEEKPTSAIPRRLTVPTLCVRKILWVRRCCVKHADPGFESEIALVRTNINV